MFAKILSALVSPFLLAGFAFLFFNDTISKDYPALGSSFSVLFFIMFLAYLFFAVPFTLVIDVFVLRLDSLRKSLKHWLRIALFLTSSLVMAMYITFLLSITQVGAMFRTFILFAIGALIFVATEAAIQLLARKSRK
jgi:hypothetical protein